MKKVGRNNELGVGKSALLMHFIRKANQEQNLKLMCCQCEEYCTRPFAEPKTESPLCSLSYFSSEAPEDGNWDAGFTRHGRASSAPGKRSLFLSC